MKSAKTDWYPVLLDAHFKAEKAVEEELARLPEDPHALDCGFAWVTIPGNHPLAVYCRHYSGQTNADGRRLYGSRDAVKGWTFWCPGQFRGQSIRIHEAGARAFRKALVERNINATMGSRYD